MDSAIGINNEGQLAFGYNLEDIDQTESGADVFNGQQSVLWKNVRAAFLPELRAMYQSLRSTGALSYDRVNNMFEDHTGKWPEAVYNEDAWFKYLAPLVEKGNAAYLSMLQGSKAEQRRWWLYNRFRYIDSKYNAGDSLTDVITVRGYAKADITVTPYADIYPTVKYGSYLVQVRGQHGVSSLLECPLDNVNDTEIMIFSASQLASVGDLSGLMVGFADFSKATRLQSLKLGDGDDYSNSNLTELYLGNNELLRSIDVRNSPALTQAVDLSGCGNLITVLFEGTSVTGLSLPNGGILRTLHLPTTVTNLTVQNQTRISDFQMRDSELSDDDFSSITTLRLENTSIDSLPILEEIAPQSRVRLIGVDWELPDYAAIEDVLSVLDTMRGLDEAGGNLPSAQVSGVIHVPSITSDQIRCVHTRRPDLVVDSEAIQYIVRFFDGTSDAPLYTALVYGGATAPDPVATGLIPAPYKESVGHTAYSFSGWDRSLLITGDTDLVATYDETVGYVVTFKNYDDTVLTEIVVASGTNCPDPVTTGVIATPTRPSDSSYIYTYLGWTGGSLNNVTADRVLTARYSTTTSYTVKFCDWDGTLLYTFYVAYGGSVPNPITVGLIETPFRPEDTSAQKTFVFYGWSGTLTNITTSRTIYAQYTETQYYYAIFVNYDNTELYRERYNRLEYATDPVAEGRQPAPTKPADAFNNIFWKWNYQFPLQITRNTTITAQFRTDEEFTVTFKDYDGTVLDTQIVTQHMPAENPITAGRIGTPLRPADAQYEYVFSYWNPSNFSDITADTTIWARYNSTVRSYTISFYDVATLLRSTTIKYGTWPVLTGALIEKPDVANPDLYFLNGWTPTVTFVQDDASYYASWVNVRTDSWADVLQSISNGTYATDYTEGDLVWLDCGTEGKILMRLIGIDKDVKEDGTTAAMTWLSVFGLATPKNHGINPVNVINAAYGFAETTDSADHHRIYISQNHSSSSYGTASASTFTITAAEALDLTVRCSCSSEAHWDMLNVWVNDTERLANAIGLPQGETVEKTYSLEAGETLTVFAQYTKDTGKNDGTDTATMEFISEGSFTITAVKESQTRAFGGFTGGWEESEVRSYLNSSVFPLLPAALQGAIVPVRKYSALASDQQIQTLDKLWVPSAREVRASSSYTSDGPIYDGFFAGNSYPFIRNGLFAGQVDDSNNQGMWLRDVVSGNCSYLYGTQALSSATPNKSFQVLLGFCL